MKPSEVACRELMGADPRMGSTLDRLVEQFRRIDDFVAVVVTDAQLSVANEYLPRSRRLAENWGAVWPEEMVTGTRAFLLTHLGAAFDDV